MGEHTLDSIKNCITALNTELEGSFISASPRFEEGFLMLAYVLKTLAENTRDLDEVDSAKIHKLCRRWYRLMSDARVEVKSFTKDFEDLRTLLLEKYDEK